MFDRFTEESPAELARAMQAREESPGFADDYEPDCSCAGTGDERTVDATDCPVHNPRPRRRGNPETMLMARGLEAVYAAMERRV